MHCWICGSIAETGEHMIKVSDLRDLFGHTTTKTPLYRKVNNEHPEIVQGSNSPKLKFQNKLCAECNNARTQLHDRSWEALAIDFRISNAIYWRPPQGGCLYETTGFSASTGDAAAQGGCLAQTEVVSA